MFLKVCPRLLGDETKVLDSLLMHKSAEICQSSWAERTCIAWSWCCSSFPRCSYKDKYLESKLPKCYSRNSHMALTKDWLHALLANPAAVSTVTCIQDFPSLCSFRFYPNFEHAYISRVFLCFTSHVHTTFPFRLLFGCLLHTSWPLTLGCRSLHSIWRTILLFQLRQKRSSPLLPCLNPREEIRRYL